MFPGACVIVAKANSCMVVEWFAYELSRFLEHVSNKAYVLESNYSFSNLFSTSFQTIPKVDTTVKIPKPQILFTRFQFVFEICSSSFCYSQEHTHIGGNARAFAFLWRPATRKKQRYLSTLVRGFRCRCACPRAALCQKRQHDPGFLNGRATGRGPGVESPTAGNNLSLETSWLLKIPKSVYPCWFIIRHLCGSSSFVHKYPCFIL